MIAKLLKRYGRPGLRINEESGFWLQCCYSFQSRMNTRGVSAEIH
jgi:hypothetical protein